MNFFSRSRVWLLPVLVGLLVAGCEKKDPLAERRFQVLLEESGRLTEAVRALDPASVSPQASPASFSAGALQALTAENDRLRQILERHEKGKALAANKTQREAIEKQVVAIRGLEFK